ncbi:LysR substrate-binding domain-containing protein [Streptomyces sp. NPDC001970]
MDQVPAGRLDLAFVSRPARCPDDVVVEPPAGEPIVLACAPEHPYAGLAQVEMAELRDEQFVDFHPDWGTRDLVDHVLAAADVERRVSLEVTDTHS